MKLVKHQRTQGEEETVQPCHTCYFTTYVHPSVRTSAYPYLLLARYLFMFKLDKRKMMLIHFNQILFIIFDTKLMAIIVLCIFDFALSAISELLHSMSKKSNVGQPGREKF